MLGRFGIALSKRRAEKKNRNFAKMQFKPWRLITASLAPAAVTADKLQPTPDHMPNAILLATNCARPVAALRDKYLSVYVDGVVAIRTDAAAKPVCCRLAIWSLIFFVLPPWSTWRREHAAFPH